MLTDAEIDRLPALNTCGGYQPDLIDKAGADPARAIPTDAQIEYRLRYAELHGCDAWRTGVDEITIACPLGSGEYDFVKCRTWYDVRAALGY